MQPTPVFLPGKSHGQRSLVGYSSWGHKSYTLLSDQTTITVQLVLEYIRLLMTDTKTTNKEQLLGFQKEHGTFSHICLTQIPKSF